MPNFIIVGCVTDFREDDPVYFKTLHCKKMVKIYQQKLKSNIEINKCFQEFCKNLFLRLHCVKTVFIRSCSGPYFPAFEPNTERYGVMWENADQNNSEYEHFRQCQVLHYLFAQTNYWEQNQIRQF